MPAPTSLDSAATLAYLMANLVNITGGGAVTQVYKGIPEQYGPQVAAAITLGGQTIERKTNTFFIRWAGYYVEFGYRVQGAEQDAEDKVALYADGLIKLIESDKTLGGTALDVQLDLSLAETPQYLTMRGFENRVYPVIIRAKQQHNVAVP